MDLPRIGLGTMDIDDPAAVELAIHLGYRHLDTAQVYGNEAVVGEGIERAEIDREELTVATKVWVDELGADDVTGRIHIGVCGPEVFVDLNGAVVGLDADFVEPDVFAVGLDASCYE